MLNYNLIYKFYYEWWKNIDKTLLLLIIFLFSPSAASFDNFKNFEDRGEQFNKLIKKLKLKKIINARH